MIPIPELFKRRLFWIVSRICFTSYRTFPVFGHLRASIALIRDSNRFLVIDRNDGRGLSLPGGLAGWREPEESTLRREVHEETGLTVMSMTLKTRYRSKAELPCNISIFEVEAAGEIKESWEGTPRWMTIAELEGRLLKSQEPAVELMRKILAQVHP